MRTPIVDEGKGPVHERLTEDTTPFPYQHAPAKHNCTVAFIVPMLCGSRFSSEHLLLQLARNKLYALSTSQSPRAPLSL